MYQFKKLKVIGFRATPDEVFFVRIYATEKRVKASWVLAEAVRDLRYKWELEQEKKRKHELQFPLF
jgi:hypothetical protein